MTSHPYPPTLSQTLDDLAADLAAEFGEDPALTVTNAVIAMRLAAAEIDRLNDDRAMLAETNADLLEHIAALEHEAKTS